MENEPIMRPALDLDEGPQKEIFSALPHNINESNIDSSHAALLAREYHRKQHFKIVEHQAHPSIVIVYGPSGSGKTTAATTLSHDGDAVSVQRLLTRPLRSSDPETDGYWHPEQVEHGLHNVLFSYGKYGTHYGFQVSNVLQLLMQGETPIVILGDASKVPPFIDAIERLVPCVPVTLVRLDAPEVVIEQRLTEKRAEAFPGEAQKRMEANRTLKEVEKPQLDAIDRIYGQTRLVSVSKGEVQELGLKIQGLRALTEKRLLHAIDAEKEKTVSYAAARAAHIIRARTLNRQADNIHPALTNVLEKQLIPTANQLGIRPALKGGLATALYLSSTYDQRKDIEKYDSQWGESRRLRREIVPPMEPKRPVSLDIDWTMLSDPTSMEKNRFLIQQITGEKLDFTQSTNKPVFHSYKIQGMTQDSSGEKVELDAIALSRVQPENKGFVFDFPYSNDIAVYRRTISISKGNTIDIVPPELLVLEKLCAGRGSEEHKFDLFDAAALLTTQPMHFPIIERILDSQEYSREQDSEITGISSPPRPGEITATLRSLPITSVSLLRILTERTLATHELNRNNKEPAIFPIAPLEWSATNLKRAALVDALLKSLDKIEGNLFTPQPNIPGSPSLAEAFGAGAVKECVLDMRQDLLFYAEFHLGRPDVYIRRSESPIIQ